MHINLTSPPKKLYKGKKRLAMRHLYASKRKVLQWALTIKPGDYVATCEGFNRKVERIEYCWANFGLWHAKGQNKTWFLDEVIFHDTSGRMHYCPGGGCAYPKETNEQITTYWRDGWVVPFTKGIVSEWFKGDEGHAEQMKRMAAAFKAGRSIVDDFGELLPEFQGQTIRQELGK